MEGAGLDGAFDTYWQSPKTSNEALDAIRQALQATLDPRVSNEVRGQALNVLEGLRNQPDSPYYGFTLAEDWNQNDAVRYYGLQLLEYAVRHRWTDFGPAQTEQLRTWVKCLAGSLRQQDALFIRNKVGQLWVEVAKRAWGDEEGGWMDMDKQLLTLWEKAMEEKGVVNKVFVLYVLETLSDEVINGEDAVAGLRLDVLGGALNEIMIPQGMYSELVNSGRKQRGEVRFGEGGWLSRMCGFFADCVKEVRIAGAMSPELRQSMAVCAVKTLNALRPTMNWISLKAAVEANCVDCCFMPFHTDDVVLQTAATETLYVLLSRPYYLHWHDAWTALHQQALRPDRVAMIRHAYDQTASGPGEDDEKYTLQKKMSEVLSVLADSVAQHPSLGEGNKLDLPSFFNLLLYVLQSKSLVVSIPVLHSWSKMMAVTDTVVIDIVLQALGALVQTCSERLLRYELLTTNDANDEIVEFLDEDFDTVPERHAFLGNYRRYCASIIQAIARSRPLEALQHVLDQMRNMLQNGPYTGGRGFDPSNYSRTSLAVLQFDAQFTVVSSALKGFTLWCHDIATLSHEDPLHAKAENDRANAEQALQEWSQGVINLHVDDPEVAAQVLQTLVSILRTVRLSASYVLHVVQHLLTMRLYDNPTHTTFSDAVKTFEGLRVLELQKLALTFAPELLEVYHELEPRIGVLGEKHSDDVRLVWGYKAFLFMIIHRAPGLDPKIRMERLQQMLRPVYEAWADPTLSASMNSLQSFCQALGLGDIADFYKAYRFDQIQDWAAHQLDGVGKARQQQIKEASDRLPLRMTKSMLAAATEKVSQSSDEFETACALWSNMIPVVLPSLLNMLRHAQAFHNLDNWSQLPDELQVVVKRTLQDRFWQSGISNESKEEFYNRISGSKTSYEGFASVVRGTMRAIREQGYHIIYLMTKFEEQFYGLNELSEPLAQALFADAAALGANHLHPIINLTTGLVQRCPPHHRASFLPPLLTQLFTTLDGKISAEWAALAAANERKAGEDEELSDEMRTESVLRQLTYSMVSFVPFLLEFDKEYVSATPSQSTTAGMNGNGYGGSPEPSLSDLVLEDPRVLEPMILFCTHALRMKDSRCCTIICKVFRSLIPLFNDNRVGSNGTSVGGKTTTPGIAAIAPQVREFISTEVLKACITSLNDPYFADMQKDLASLIALIIHLYSSHTETPKQVLLSLPNMDPTRVESAVRKVAGGTAKSSGKLLGERQQRAIVLDLLDGVRGVSIYEAGKIRVEGRSKGTKKGAGGGLQGQYMEVEARPAVPAEGEDGALEGVAGLFGDG
jgi:exportin-5